MRICCVGAGSLGGFMSAKLGAAGADVVVVDRGHHRAAIRAQGGLVIIEPDRSPTNVPVSVIDINGEPGSFDVVILGVKAMDLPTVAAQAVRLLRPEGFVVTIQNGMPWWYFQRHGGPLEGTRLQTLDPDGILGQAFDASRIVGCVAYPAVECPEPGVVRLVSGGRFPVGELNGTHSERVENLVAAFEAAGLRSRVLDDVRAEIWLKALGNLAFNPISALTRSTMADICDDPDTLGLARAMMTEAAAVARAIGVTLRRTVDERLEGAAKVGHHKTSMLQDLEVGRRLEVDALVGSVAEIGRLVRVPTPLIDAVYALTKRLDAVAS